MAEGDNEIKVMGKEELDALWAKIKNTFLASTLKGAASGVAELDSNGLVPSSQLPSYVDDVLEYASKSAFPATGTSGKIYVALDTNLTYRWSGSAYVEISPSLALGETSFTAYRGDRGKTAYTHATDASRLTTAKSSGFYKFATTAEGHIASVTAVTASDLTSLIGSTTYAPYNANGYLPLSGGTMSNTNLVTNLNADRLDGFHANALGRIFTSSIVEGKAIRITFDNIFSAIISVRRTNGDSSLVLVGTGYGENTIRNSWSQISESIASFKWSVPATDSLVRCIEISNTAGNPANVYVLMLNNATPTFTAIDELYSTGVNNPLATIKSNVASATKLQTARSINGTSFNGTADITTAKWGTARNISIADSDSANTGTAVSVNGSAAVTLKLPATIKAALSGNATSATKATNDSDDNAINTTYLKKSGGTMTGNINFSQAGAAYNSNGVTWNDYVLIGCDAANGLGVYAETISFRPGSHKGASSGKGLVINTTTIGYNGNTVWHAGNDGSGSGLDADKLDGYHNTDFLRRIVIDVGTSSVHKSYDANSYTQNDTLYESFGDVVPSYTDAWDNFPTTSAPIGGFSLMNIKEGGYRRQIFGCYNDNHLFIRSQFYSGSSTVWKDWKKVALTTDNVASATKLETSRTLWGQSFNGAGNVSGDMSSVGHIAMLNNKAIYIKDTSANDVNCMTLTDGNNFSIGYGAGVSGYNTKIFGQTISFYAGTALAATIDNNKNLSVGGNTLITGGLTVSGGVSRFGAASQCDFYFKRNTIASGTPTNYIHIPSNARLQFDLHDEDGATQYPILGLEQDRDVLVYNNLKANGGLAARGIADLSVYGGSDNVVTNIQISGSSTVYTPQQGKVTLPAYPTWSSLSGKPTLATVATTGSYTDLLNQPSFAKPLSSFTVTNMSSVDLPLLSEQPTYMVFTCSSTSYLSVQLNWPSGTLVKDIIHYILFKNTTSSAMTITMPGNTHTVYAPAKTMTVAANSCMELSYVYDGSSLMITASQELVNVN